MRIPDRDDVQRAVGERYEVTELVGAGGMGAVFRARHRALGSYAAVKILPPEVAASEIRRQRFQREASLTARLSHPNIVPVYEFDDREGLTFLIMPFVTGDTLATVLERHGRLDVARALDVVRHIGAALDFIHARRIVHRDVKPANILIERDTGRALLTDFGVARADSVTTGADSLTVPGTVIGTPLYMSPEQVTAFDRVGGQADLYSLAIVAYEALSGGFPPAGAGPADLARHLHAARPDVPPALAAALVAPLAERPGDRPETAGAWLALLDEAAAGVGRRRARTRRWLVAAGAAAALGVIALVALRDGRCGDALRPHVAVMPPVVLGEPPYPTDQLTEYFNSRFRPVPGLDDALAYRRVTARVGGRPVSASEADSAACRLRAAFFVQPVFEFAGATLTMSATLHGTGGRRRATAQAAGTVAAPSPVMDAVWTQLLGEAFTPHPKLDLPRGDRPEAVAAYLEAEDAFRHADYDRALARYDETIARHPDFAPAYFRRLLVVAQVNPREETLRRAMAGAERRRGDLKPADSLLLEGYTRLVRYGDGPAALDHFRRATEIAPEAPLVWFVLGEFHLFFGQLFDHGLAAARQAFDRALDLDPGFAPAIANRISLAIQEADDAEARRLIAQYLALDSTSVIAQLVGVVDTVLYGPRAAALRLLNTTLERRPFILLEYLAFQAAQFGTGVDSSLRMLAIRRTLRALERQAADDYERAVALRWGVAADLAAGFADSARLRLGRSPATGERARWIVLAGIADLPSLGDAAAAVRRLPAGASEPLDAWLAARANSERARHTAVLRRLASDTAPLPSSLVLDLDARTALARGDTTRALDLWDRATRRYAAFAAPFDLVASLWPLRRDLARTAIAARDTARAVRACGTFNALIGYVDQVVKGEMDRICRDWRGLGR